MTRLPALNSSSLSPDASHSPAVPFRGILGGLRALAPVTAVSGLLVGMVLGLGFVIRLIASIRLSPHVDEASSVLAAHATAAHGWPVLPSGTVYFQGATLSWILTPLVWIGWGELNHLVAMRFVTVLAGTLTIWLCYRLCLAASGDSRVGLVMASLVAIDPVSVQWSGHVRMYGLLQAVVAGLAWAFILLLSGKSSRGRMLLVVALFWVAVFTHIGASLLGPAMLGAILLVHGRSLLQRRDLLAGIALCGIAPVTLLTLNSVLGSSSVGAGDTSSRPLLTFVGDNLLQPLARFRGTFAPSSWDLQATELVWLVPGLIVAIATIIGGHQVLRQPRSHISRQHRINMIALLSMYWLSLIVVGVFTVSPKERYLLHVHVIGYLFVAVLIVNVIDRRSRQGDARGGRLAKIVPAGLVVLVVLAIGSALGLRLLNPVVHPDYHAALAYVADRQQPGEPIVVALPPVAWLVLDESDRDDLIYLAGSEDQERAQRYTRITTDGRHVDYWIGNPAIDTSAGLVRILAKHHDAWIVIDEERLRADWAYAGEIEDLLDDGTIVAHQTPGGGLVLRVKPDAASPASETTARPEIQRGVIQILSG